MPAPKRVAAATAMEVSRTASLKVVSSSIVRAAAASGLSRFLAAHMDGVRSTRVELDCADDTT